MSMPAQHGPPAAPEDDARWARLRFLENMAVVDEAIQNAAHIEEMMGAVLEATLRVFGCDRAWLLHPADPDAGIWTIPMERTVPEYPGAVAAGVPLLAEPEMAGILRAARASDTSLALGPGNDHPLMTDGTRRFGIQAMLMTLIYPRTGEPYLFGLHQCSGPRVWTAEEKGLLKVIGRRVADALTTLLIHREQRESKQRLEEAERVAQMGHWEVRFDTGQVRLSREARNITGLPPEISEYTLSKWLAWLERTVGSDEQADDARLVERLLAGALTSFDIERWVRLPGGESRAVRAQGHLELDARGRPKRLFGVLRDVTELKRTRDSLELFRMLIDRVNDSIEILDLATGRFLDVNAHACEIHGLTREEYLSRSAFDMDADLDEAAYRETTDHLRRTGSRVYVGHHTRKDGSRFPVEINLGYARLDREYMIAVVRDVTERQRALEQIRESEERFRELAETVREAFWVASADETRLLYVSPAFETIWGRARESALASPPLWVETVHPDDVERVLGAGRAQAAGGPAFDQVYRIRRPDGEVRWIHAQTFPVKNAAGRTERFVGVARDVTDQKLADEKRARAEEQLRQSQKMEAIGLLAGGVAHDFNNILAAIIMHAEAAADIEGLPHAARDDLLGIHDAASRAANLTQQLLLFSRRQVIRIAALDLNEAVSNLIKMLQRIIGEDVRLELRLHPRPLRTRADPGMLDQLLVNLAVNARDAMPRGGRLLIETGTRMVDEASAGPGRAPGEYVWLSVTDTGKGIPADVLPRIFEPFFTTKEAGRGTGLGLATVFGIVEQHRGWIKVYSVEGKGASFETFLPACPSAPKTPAHGVPRVKPRGGTETILVVEDESAVRSVVRTMLQRSGYHVLEAPSGDEAIPIWEKEQQHVALLLTDLVMPGSTSGLDLARRLQADRPELKVVLTSGYSPDTAGRELELRPQERFLSKPFSSAALLETVRACLDE